MKLQERCMSYLRNSEAEIIIIKFKMARLNFLISFLFVSVFVSLGLACTNDKMCGSYYCCDKERYVCGRIS